MRKWIGAVILVGISLVTPILNWRWAGAQEPVINAVLFFSPTCSHCHKVMNDDLPPLQDQYGSQLQILEINVQSSEGQRVYQDYLQKFNVPDERLGVPALVVGDRYFIGSVEIPQFFPGEIENGLAAGGIDWPDLNGLQNYLEEFGLSSPEKLTVGEIFTQDPLGNSISAAVLLGMVLSVVGVWNLYNRDDRNVSQWPKWVIPVLTLIGLAVAIYLTYIEFTHTEAVCGPVGDCNAVQGSQYAQLFGFIPVALLGVLGFLGVGTAWAVHTFGDEQYRQRSGTVLWTLALLGTLFSIYLTFLEPFVIGATCAWCITSALAMTLILWAATFQIVHLRGAKIRRRGYRKFKTRRARR